MVDLLKKHNSQFNMLLNKKQNKFAYLLILIFKKFKFYNFLLKK